MKPIKILKAAKKTAKTPENLEDGNTNLFDIISKFDKESEVLETSSGAKIDEWISTGFYILNAAISGSIFGGMPNKRSMTLGGEPGCLPADETIKLYKFTNPKLVKNHKIINIE